MARPLRLGLTGGIASGKSTVCGFFEARGWPVVDADAVYHRLLAEDPELLGELREEFGNGVFAESGALDRKALGAVVFADRAKLARLGEITHPRVRAAMVAALQRAAAGGPPGVVGAIPLLFENGLEALFDQTVVVTVPPAVQRARLMARDGLDAAAADARIASQMDPEARAARGDHTVSNAGDPAATEAEVDALISRLTGADRPVASGDTTR